MTTALSRVAHKKRSGHHVLTGLGIGALFTVLTPFIAVPFALIGAGTGALVKHAEGSLPKKDIDELTDALTGNEAALAVVSNKTDVGRVEQMFPGASQRHRQGARRRHGRLRRRARAGEGRRT